MHDSKKHTTLPTQRHSVLLSLFDVVFAVSLLLMMLSWFFDPFYLNWKMFHLSVGWGLKPVVVPLALLAIRLALRKYTRTAHLRGVADTPLFKKICLAVLTPFFCLFLLEWCARIAGVSPVSTAPIVIVGEEDTDTHIVDNKIVADPELLFAFKPNVNWAGFPINSKGFRTREFSETKQEGVTRFLALGDSCTAQGLPPYSDRLHELLQVSPPGGRQWEAFNNGVFGYSSLQGYRQFQRYGRNYQPDVVSIYFGWNDHWLYGKPDHQRMAVRMHRIPAAFIRALKRKRFYGLLSHLVSNPDLDAQQEAGGVGFRVPPDMYTTTLTSLINEIRDIGAVPLLITAPRRELHGRQRRVEYANAERQGEIEHDQYVELTRAVAASNNVELLDLANIFAPPQYDELFSKDGIHFREEGLQKIAELLLEKLHDMEKEGKLK
jgi:lysophospholipase L1-like esterase